MSADDTRQRLQAYLASCGLGSRRACERFIVENRVQIDGRPATLGESVLPGQEVALDGKVLQPQERLRYIALNKPPGFVVSMADEKGRPVAASLLGGRVSERVYNVGRLDQWSKGLLLFTNDGELTARLVHPSGGMDKEYEVITDLPVPAGLPAEFEAGIEIEGIRYRAESVRLEGPKALRIVLIEGKNREIRRVLEHYGLRALSLTRVRIGPVSLGGLAEGSWRDLEMQEVAALKAYGRDGRKKPVGGGGR
jgi:23S rRNA pseudouridine2605 synthase